MRADGNAAGTGPAQSNRPTLTDLMREDVEKLLSTSSMPVHMWISQYRAVFDRCTAADRESLILRYAITWLVSNGLVVAATDGAFERYFPCDLEEPFAGDVDAKVSEAVERRAGFDRAAAAMRQEG